jgi:hypothetical protein
MFAAFRRAFGGDVAALINHSQNEIEGGKVSQFRGFSRPPLSRLLLVLVELLRFQRRFVDARDCAGLVII